MIEKPENKEPDFIAIIAAAAKRITTNKKIHKFSAVIFFKLFSSRFFAELKSTITENKKKRISYKYNEAKNDDNIGKNDIDVVDIKFNAILPKNAS